MSAAAAESDSPIVSGESRTTNAFRSYAAGLFALTIAVLVTTWLISDGRWTPGVEILPWVVAACLAGALPIRTGNRLSFAFDLPVLLAAGFVLGPLAAGLAGLVGTIEVDEFRGRGSFWVSIYNRAQTALAAMAAAFVFAAMGSSPGKWPAVGLAALVALLADAAVNYLLVAFGVVLLRQVSIQVVLRDMRIGDASSFAVEYGCLGLLGILLAEVFAAIDAAALLLFALPLVLGHALFRLRQRSAETKSDLQVKQDAISILSQQMAEERRDERLAVAGELHDEVLPSLFKVHLLGQVIRHDLAAGRLFELDQDVPELIVATNVAQDAIRGVVSSLRRSILGGAGLVGAVRLLGEQLQDAGELEFLIDCEPIVGTEHAQLVLYQAVREAMNNAARHSKGSSVHVTLRCEDGVLRGVIEDDGVGFLASAAPQGLHFGLQLVRERVEAVGGGFVIDSRLGGGTCVSLAVPANA